MGTADKEQKSALARAHYLRHREKIIARVKAYRLKNRETVLAKGREYRVKNAEAIRERRREYDAEHREQKRAADRARRADPARRAASNAASRERWLADPTKVLFGSARTRAKKGAVPFTLTLEDVRALYAKGQCECCKAFVCSTARETPGGPAVHAATIDRVIPSKGYTPENTALLCWSCNRRKNDSTLEQLEQVVAWLRTRTA